MVCSEVRKRWIVVEYFMFSCEEREHTGTADVSDQLCFNFSSGHATYSPINLPGCLHYILSVGIIHPSVCPNFLVDASCRLEEELQLLDIFEYIADGAICVQSLVPIQRIAHLALPRRSTLRNHLSQCLRQDHSQGLEILSKLDFFKEPAVTEYIPSSSV